MALRVRSRIHRLQGTLKPRLKPRWDRRQRNRKPLAIARDGPADRQLKSAVSTREIHPSADRIGVRAFDHEPIQITWESCHERDSNSGAPDMIVAQGLKAGLRPVIESEGRVH